MHPSADKVTWRKLCNRQQVVMESLNVHSSLDEGIDDATSEADCDLIASSKWRKTPRKPKNNGGVLTGDLVGSSALESPKPMGYFGAYLSLTGEG